MSQAPSKHDDGGPIPAEWKLSCLQCGYDLTGLTRRVCPECGTQFTPRSTWEANRAGAMPEMQRKRSDLIGKLSIVGIVVGLIGFSYLGLVQWGPKARPYAAAGIAVGVVVGLGEAWIRLSSVSPLVVRIVVGGICLIIAMIVLVP